MNILNTNLDGLFVLEYPSFKDDRGEFIKTIHENTFKDNGLNSDFKESFFSISNKYVLRGMHFQTEEHAHDKLVYVISGRILDVVLDLRTNSSTFGKTFSIVLNTQHRKSLFIGKGFAHGFLSLEDNSIVEYHTTTVQNKNYESGVLWNSFNFDWQIQSPVLSIRDSQFDNFNDKIKYF